MKPHFPLLTLPGCASSKAGCTLAVVLSALALTGCESPKALRLAPLSPELERVENGGARSLVLVNTSDQELHNCTFTAYLSDQNDPNPLLRLQPFARCSGSKSVWSPGEEARFRNRQSPTLQFTITEPLTRVEVVGHCDEGSFHQSWRITESEDEVRPPGVKAQFAPFPFPGALADTAPAQP